MTDYKVETVFESEVTIAEEDRLSQVFNTGLLDHMIKLNHEDAEDLRAQGRVPRRVHYRVIIEVATGGAGQGEDGERCDSCGRHYQTIYRVPNEVWSMVAPRRDRLGDYPGHRLGGLLCVDCAWRAARELGVTLYFEGHVGEWPQSGQVTLPVVVNNSRDEEVSCLDAITQLMDHFGLDDAARERLAGYLYDRHGPSARGLDEDVIERLTRWGPPY